MSTKHEIPDYKAQSNKISQDYLLKKEYHMRQALGLFMTANHIESLSCTELLWKEFSVPELNENREILKIKDSSTIIMMITAKTDYHDCKITHTFTYPEYAQEVTLKGLLSMVKIDKERRLIKLVTVDNIGKWEL